jgi:hypothetical protein
MTINFHLSSVLTRANHLLNHSRENPQYLFYTALELRYAIEILLDDWLNFSIYGSHSLANYLQELYANNIPEGSLDVPPNPKIANDEKKAKKFYSVEDYRNKIKELAPEFEKKIEFMSILNPNYDRMKAPDLALLNTYYGRVGRLLHYPKFEINPREIYSELNSILSYFETYDDSSRCFLTLNEEGEKMFKKYIHNELTDDEMNDIRNNGNKYHSGGFYILK